MPGFTKLFSSIVTSSVWVEDNATLRVWIAMLALADAEGSVEGSVPGFANLARVSVAEMEAALATLSSPDPHSRTTAAEGRRIEPFEGGWRILNYEGYRARGEAKEGSRAPYMREYRRRKSRNNKRATRNNRNNKSVTSVTRDTEAEAEERSKREKQQKSKEKGATSAPPARAPADHLEIYEHWNSQEALITHRALTPRMVGHIRARLSNGYDVQDIKRGISKYAELVGRGHGPGHNKWSLSDLLSRGAGEWLERHLEPRLRRDRST